VIRESFGALVCNTALLLLLVYVRDLLNAFHWVSGAWIRQVIAGLAIGVIGICVMLMPWTFVPGIIFDTRSVLLDMTMPGMTTDDIVQAIRDIDAHVPILLTSGYTSSDTVKRMLADGIVQGFLAKPYETEVLFVTIARLMHTTEGGGR
jgi:CheY-like chemotaxis protein